MTTIDKLLIRGVRSYPPDASAVILFYKPLTIIVGPNGCGKTTIIESLRYATTGNLPPNCSNGQAFVHDCRVVGETEVKGQIKLRFESIDGNPVVSIRSMQLLQKKEKQQFKVLEAALVSINAETGEKITISKRCADIDKEVPELMGVPKSVLDNVIFCHQEDSNWPLGDSSTLKKKFDDIFAATRYTKALDSIKKFRSEQLQEIKLYSKELERIGEHRFVVREIQSSRLDLVEKIKNAEAEMESLRVREEKERNEFNVAQSNISSVREADAEIKRLEDQISFLNDKIKGLEKEIDTVFKDSDSELQELLDSFEKKIEDLTKNTNDLEKEYEAERNAVRDLSKKSQKYHSIIGKKNSVLEDIQRLEKDLSDLISELLNNDKKITYLNSFSGSSLIKNDSSLLGDSLKQLLGSMKIEFDEIQKNKEIKLAMSENNMNTVKEKLIQAKGSLKSTQEQIKKCESKVVELESKYERYFNRAGSNSDMTKLNDLRKELSEIQGQLSVEESMFDFEKSRENIRKCNISKKEIEEKINKTNASIRIEDKLEVTRSEVKHIKDNIDDKEKYLISLVNETSNLAIEKSIDIVDFENFSGFLFPEETSTLSKNSSCCIDFNTLKLNLESKKSILKNSIKNNSELVKKVNDSCSSSGTKLEMTRKRFNENQIKLKELETLFSKSSAKFATIEGFDENIDIQKVPEMRNSTEKRLQAIKKQFFTLDLTKEMYERYLSQAKEDGACPVCNRELIDDEVTDFDDCVKEFISRIPESLEKTQLEMNKFKSMMDDLFELLPSSREYTNAKENCSSLEIEIQNFEKEYSTLLTESDQLSHQLVKDREKLDIVNELVVLSSTMVKSFTELTKLRREYFSKFDSFPPNSNIHSSDSEFLSKELEGYLREVNTLNNKIIAFEKNHNEKETKIEKYKKRINELERMIKDATSSESDMQVISKQINETKEELAQLRSIESKKLGSLAPLSKQIGEYKKIYNESKSSFIEKEKSLGADIMNIEKFCSRSFDLNSNLGTTKARLASIEKDLDNINTGTDMSLIASREENLKLLEDRLSEQRKTISSEKDVKRNLQDNLEKRRVENDIKSIKEKISTIKENQKGLPSLSNAQKTLKEYNERLNSIGSNIASLEGSLSSRKETLQAKDKELKREIYKDIENEFKSMMVKLKTAEMASSDLDKYYKALDIALMRYHSQKMKNVNDIIRELWQSCYRGNDIDSIEIRFDAIGQEDPFNNTDQPTKKRRGGKLNKASTLKKGRSHNYRVVMLKGDLALDMRGRCSAGQRVLASLVIRLALADTFGLNCGILALDEPTTNLDRANAESLAHALNRIIETRSKTGYFQLILITHDESFVSMLSQGQSFCDHYWRVSKNEEGKSLISRQEMSSLEI